MLAEKNSKLHNGWQRGRAKADANLIKRWSRKRILLLVKWAVYIWYIFSVDNEQQFLFLHCYFLVWKIVKTCLSKSYKKQKQKKEKNRRKILLKKITTLTNEVIIHIKSKRQMLTKDAIEMPKKGVLLLQKNNDITEQMK